MFERAALVHYHEIGLKGRNRASFERRLISNLAAATSGLTEGRIERVASRLVVPVTDRSRVDELLAAVALTPGVAHVSDAYVVARDAEAMERAALLAARGAGDFATFAIEARRSATDWPESGREMNVRLGDVVRRETGKRVDLTHPDVTVWVEVVQGEVYVAARRLHGPGGLPVGVSGKVVGLLSAGIDSPVACWRMLKRGAVVVAVHFSGVPHTNDLSQRLVHELVGTLEPALGIGRVYTVPFGDLQHEISLAAPPDLRVLLYRRLMVRVAERVAALEGAKALATGESLGQVASQTLENVAAVDAVATLPVLRPLIGMDKLEIIANARAIGTYEISTQQHADCCTLFMPRTPHTHATAAECEAGEAGLDIDRMVADALSGMTHRDFRCPAYKPPKA